MENPVLRRFRRFKEMLVSTDIPNDILLELLESYIQSDDDEQAAEVFPILDGQLSLFDLAG